MTDEELLGYLRRSSVGYTHPLRLAADRIEALVRELATSNEIGRAFEEDAGQQRARAERLEAALREIIDEDQHQSEWRYWEKEDGHWARKARAALDPVAAPDPAAIREAALREAAAACEYVIKNIAIMKPDGETYETPRVQKIARGLVDVARQDILALIPKGAADDRA